MEDFEKRENDNVVPLGAPEGQNNNPPAPANEVAPAAEAQATVYRWNYDESAAFEASKTKKKASRGAVIYAVVVSIAFILSFAAGLIFRINALLYVNDIILFLLTLITLRTLIKNRASLEKPE